MRKQRQLPNLKSCSAVQALNSRVYTFFASDEWACRLAASRWRMWHVHRQVLDHAHWRRRDFLDYRAYLQFLTGDDPDARAVE